MPAVLLLANGPTGLSAIESLSRSATLVGAVRQVAQETRDQDPVLQHARTHNIDIYTDSAPSAVDSLVRRLQPDCVVVSSYDRILPAELLQVTRFVNVHYAPLPRYRGRACVNWAIINGEPFTAITIHEMASELDAGNVLFQRTTPIGPSDTVGDLYERLNEIQRSHLGEVVARYLAGDRGTAQSHADATYGCTRLPEDGEIDWTASTRTTDRLIRALTDPYPGAYTHLEGRKLVICKAHPVADPKNFRGRIPGRVVAVSAADGHVDVLTGDGVLRLLEVKPEGRKTCPAAQAISSVRTTLGLKMGHLMNRIARLEEQIEQLQRSKTTEPNPGAIDAN